jgi:dihydroxy-acid dehydratase
MLDKGALTVTGQSIWDNVRDAPNWNSDVIRTFDNPHTAHGGMVILRGNLCPDGAVLKPSAATPALMSHRGRAVVFESIEDYRARINDESLDVDESCILVLKYCGPKGYPGMAEVGNMGLPPKVLRKGVRDMVRISDARMSGTAYGTVVLHVCPEAAAGGTLALVENGDVIELDVEARRLTLEVGEDELARRRERWRPPAPAMTSGYQKLYVDTVLQASEGADLDFLRGCRGAAIPRESH